MNLDRVHNVYFIGIGGIGMSALARYFKFIGKQVAGYDKTETTLTKELVNDGILVHYHDDIHLIPDDFKNIQDTLVVYTPAVPNNHTEYLFFEQHDFQIHKRSVVLGFITKDSFCLAVAGTHGKTTTSAILAHLLKECGLPLTAFLGGISENFNSNFCIEGNEYTVVEADEFDRSFLHLAPNIACITAMDADHLDIYGSKEALEESFIDFTKNIKENGQLFIRKGLALPGITYGIEENADYDIKSIRIIDGIYHFDIHTPTTVVKNVIFKKPGRHNLLNALAAFAMADAIKCPIEKLVEGLQSFKGIQRRFSYQVTTAKRIFVDDYAHHPVEIDAVHQAVREVYPNDKVLVVFQPHLFSRTKDFADDFAKSLSRFDEVVLLDIYPARELPIEGVTAEWLLQKIENEHKQLSTKENLIEHILKSDARIILTVGAGDIGVEVQKIKNALLSEN
ncbi:UDP-N-acetylmuramate--L-alanine ligase [Zhouia sp. PK063]|uniref:UDP-N-acetylmuramate--L-alanine ligase n=1 Tax=Zhouia sp. PK063 TaxID=3373602 RepID=UPI0037A68CB3